MKKYLVATFITDRKVLERAMEEEASESGEAVERRFPVQGRWIGETSSIIEGEAQSIMFLIGRLADSGDDGLISVLAL